MSQNYQPGQLVRLARVGFSKFDASANDLYEVLRLMPRIKPVKLHIASNH